jgi:hypothetical protein
LRTLADEQVLRRFLVLGMCLIVVALDFVCSRFAKPRRAARRVEPLAPRPVAHK